MNSTLYKEVKNEEPFNVSDIPELTESEFRDLTVSKAGKNERIISFFCMPSEKQNSRLIMIIANDRTCTISVFSTLVYETYQSLTPICAQAHMFEREIAEQWNIIPKGHPWLKPLRFHTSFNSKSQTLSSSIDENNFPADTEFYRVEGEGIHEVAVGPVHAGVIEPGHFRFQCQGEKVLSLEIALGFQHRGIEKALIGGPDIKTLHLMETAAGDSTIAHASAYCGIMKSLAGTNISKKAQILWGIMLELERMANHVGDLGALAGDVAYLPTSSLCGKLRGDLLNITARICGNRFGRNFLYPNGVKEDLTETEAFEIIGLLANIFEKVESAVELLWKTPSVLSRFENTGKLTSTICRLLGIVGVPARACGLKIDARSNFPTGIYRDCQIPVAKVESGDVFARAMIRWQELVNSRDFVLQHLEMIHSEKEKLLQPDKQIMPNMCVISLVEGWRGEVCHTAITDNKGKLSSYKIVDPSFHNWPALAMALRNEQISNFPLCNKSFNLSYCGHDL